MCENPRFLIVFRARPSSAGVHAADGLGAGPCHLLPGSGSPSEQVMLIVRLGFDNGGDVGSPVTAQPFAPSAGGGNWRQYRWRLE